LVLTHSFLDLWRITLDPTENGTWVDLDSTLLHHLGQIAVADAVLAVPPHPQQDDLGWKATALEQRQQDGSSVDRPSLYGQG
jgi:hypothetical protein